MPTHPSIVHVAEFVGLPGTFMPSWGEGHPVIGAGMRLRDYGITENCQFVVMELFDDNLQSYLTADRCPTPLPSEIMFSHLGSGLHHLHANGIVHRDLKPDNVVICCRPDLSLRWVAIADFGEAWRSRQWMPRCPH